MTGFVFRFVLATYTTSRICDLLRISVCHANSSAKREADFHAVVLVNEDAVDQCHDNAALQFRNVQVFPELPSTPGARRRAL